MSEPVELRYKPLDYALLAKKNYWTIKDAVKYLARYHLRDRRYLVAEDGSKEYNTAVNTISLLVDQSVESNDFIISVREYDDASCEMDDSGQIKYDLDLNECKVTPVDFIFWAAKKNLDLPEEFKKALPYYNWKGTTADNKKLSDATGVQNGVEAGCGNEATDDKYPIYKELKFDGLPKDKFDELKRHYGMLRGEESKWRRAVTIAAKIGILFYERSLNVPTTRQAFLAAYKAEFDVIIQNDSLAKHIYSNLPDNYQGVTKTPQNRSDVDLIISAAVLAGAQSGDRESMNVKSLSKSLAVERYDNPGDDILEKIIAAVMKLEVEENE